jgi:DNA-binding IclR family transcriptional regulator
MATTNGTRKERARAPRTGVSGTPQEADALSVRALARGLSILTLFDIDHREWTIDEIAERTGLLRMTAYRMVRTLEAASFLVRDRVTNKYHVGPAALALSYVSDGFSDFVHIARPFLEALTQETGESVTLAIEVDGLSVCVDVVDTTRPFIRRTAPGRIIGSLATVHGKIFTAFKPEEERALRLAEPLPKMTPHTETDPQRIADELADVARHDVAFDEQGFFLDLCAVGAPIRNQVGDVVAAISVVMPAGRYDSEARQRSIEAVKHTATQLSNYLGWNAE